MRGRTEVKVQCKTCERAFTKRKDSLKTWNGHCRNCAAREGMLRRWAEDNGVERAKNFTFDGTLCGDAHWNWRGGVTPIHTTVRKSPDYAAWRTSVFTRDRFRCVRCGEGGELNAHHIHRFAEIMRIYKIKSMARARKTPELWNVNNGVTLCVGCHSLVHKRRNENQEKS